MFVFEKCSYDELQKIRHKENLLLSGWTLLEKEYIDETVLIKRYGGNAAKDMSIYNRSKGSGCPVCRKLKK